jgi:hypothetical protein
LAARGPLPISTIFSSDEEGQENPNQGKKFCFYIFIIIKQLISVINAGKIFSSKAAYFLEIKKPSKSSISPERCNSVGEGKVGKGGSGNNKRHSTSFSHTWSESV